MAKTDSIRACRYCGNGFTRSEKGSPALFCSIACRDEHQRRWRAEWVREHYRYDKAAYQARRAKVPHCSVDGCVNRSAARGMCLTHHLRMQRYGTTDAPPRKQRAYPRVERACVACGVVMQVRPSDERTCCSRTCARRQAIAARGLTPIDPTDVPCAGCGITHRRKVKKEGEDAGRYCSRVCYQDTRTRKAREIEALERIGARGREASTLVYRLKVLPEIQALHRIARYVERPATYRGCCKDCGASLVIRRTRGSVSVLCDGCKAERKQAAKARMKRTPAHKARKRIAKAKRRAIERGAAADNIDPLMVFARDRWTCQLCKVKTPQKLRGSCEPNAPELDHIIPLARGGTHTWGNVQCLCRQCNGNKGASAIGQLGFSLAA